MRPKGESRCGGTKETFLPSLLGLSRVSRGSNPAFKGWGIAFTRLATIAVVSLVAGCSNLGSSSPRPIAAKAPASAIVLKAPATVNESGSTMTFPAGEYRMVREDRGGYYFQAPQKVIVDDVAVYAYEGGLYVARNAAEPAHWYINRSGKTKIGRFKKIPPHKLIP
jgi:hypothetical protein